MIKKILFSILAVSLVMLHVPQPLRAEKENLAIFVSCASMGIIAIVVFAIGNSVAKGLREKSFKKNKSIYEKSEETYNNVSKKTDSFNPNEVERYIKLQQGGSNFMYVEARNDMTTDLNKIKNVHNNLVLMVEKTDDMRNFYANDNKELSQRYDELHKKAKYLPKKFEDLIERIKENRSHILDLEKFKEELPKFIEFKLQKKKNELLHIIQKNVHANGIKLDKVNREVKETADNTKMIMNDAKNIKRKIKSIIRDMKFFLNWGPNKKAHSTQH